MRIVLNKGQEEVVNAAINWFLHSSEQVFQIAGAAGTGKSVVIAEIIERLKLEDDQILPMAYTGQACSVMRTRGFANARTIYSGLYDLEYRIKRDKFGDPIMDPVFNTIVKERYFKPKDYWTFDQNIKLIVIDEAYMVPKRMRKVIEGTGAKILAAGDPNQLPPVSGEPGFLVDGNIMYLTELVRQSDVSPIILLANSAIRGQSIEPGFYSNGEDSVLVMYENELNLDIISACPVILTDTNDIRDRYNNIMRHDIFGIDSDMPVLGERMVCRKNDWNELNKDNLPLTNGLTGTVVFPPGPGSRDSDGTIPISFMPDVSPHPFDNIRINQAYLNSDAPTRHLMSENKYTKGELFEYAYAITVHCSQGSEYTHGMYIDSRYGYSPKSNAARYTAITRFKHQMIYVIQPPRYWYYYTGGINDDTH